MERKENTIVLTDDRMEEARLARDFLTGEGWEVVTVPADIPLWDEDRLAAFAAPLAERLAGVIHPAPPRILCSIEAASEEDWERAANEGALAAWCVTKVFGNLFREKKHGSVIYLNSIHAEKPVGYVALFSMGCGAAQMLCREANQDYGTDGVCFYFIQKGITESDPPSRSPVSPLYCGVDLRYPERKMPESGELNGLIAFLLTPAARPLTGSDLRADGGMTMFYTHRHRVEGRRYRGLDD